jgi:hypothetical protein
MITGTRPAAPTCAAGVRDHDLQKLRVFRNRVCNDRYLECRRRLRTFTWAAGSASLTEKLCRPNPSTQGRPRRRQESLVRRGDYVGRNDVGVGAISGTSFSATASVRRRWLRQQAPGADFRRGISGQGARSRIRCSTANALREAARPRIRLQASACVQRDHAQRPDVLSRAESRSRPHPDFSLTTTEAVPCSGLRASHPGSPPAAAPPRRTGSDA